MTDDVVIVGASVAGVRTAEALRRRGFDARITLIGAEPHLPYDRPPLSKAFLTGHAAEGDIVLLDGDRLDRLELDLRLGEGAAAVDVATRQIEDGATAEDVLWAVWAESGLADRGCRTLPAR